MMNQMKDLTRWYFLKNLTMERTAIMKAVKKKATVPRNEARVACLVAGSVVAVIKNVSATINIRRVIFPHLNMKALLFVSIVTIYYITSLFPRKQNYRCLSKTGPRRYRIVPESALILVFLAASD